MPHAAFRQADIERILRAAKKLGAVVTVDLRSWVVTINPNPERDESADDGPVRYGTENWEGYEDDAPPPTDRRRGPGPRG